MPAPVIPGASTWTFIGNGAAGTAAALGIEALALRATNAETDHVTFQTPGRPFDAPPLFALDSTVTIQRAGVNWFVGRVTRVPCDGAPGAESQGYELSGPWWYLEHLICRQQWNVKSYASGTGYTTATALSTRLILGQAIDGTFLTTGGVITATLAYAISAGAPLAIGIIDPAIYAPLAEVKDVSCAEVIKHMLRWHPDCVAWFDYAAATPTLHIRPRANLAPVALAVGAAPVSKVGGITARTDLRPPSVFIQYEVAGSSNGQPTFNIVTEAAPAGATGAEFGSLCFTIPLRGTKSTTVKQRVVTQGIADNLTAYTSDQVRDYLIGQYGEMAAVAADPNVTTDGITITKISRALANPNAKVPDPTGATTIDPISGQPVPSLVAAVYDETLTNQLLEGSITDWMRKNDAVKAQVHRLTFTYTADSGSGEDGGNDANDGTASNQTYQGTLEVTATNAGYGSALSTALYSELSDYNPGQTVPLGLAAAFYASVATLQYSGTVVLVEAEASGVAGLGNALNLTGAANAAWATMAEAVHQVEVDVDTGTTTLTFGPMDTLRPQDMVALLDQVRPGGMLSGKSGGDGPGAVATANSDTRVSGTAGGTAGSSPGQSSVDYGVTHPVTNACSISGAASAPTVPQPFDVIAATGADPSAVYGQVNPNSLFLQDESSEDTIDVSGIGTSMALTPGLVWVQMTPDGNGIPNAVSMQSEPTGYGNDRIIYTGSGTDADPFVWSKSCIPAAQMFASSGTAAHGGMILKSSDGTAAVEVVNLCGSHLGATKVVPDGRSAWGIVKTSAASGS